MSKKIIFLSFIFTFLFSCSVFASDTNWVAGYAHDYSGYHNWLFGYGINTNIGPEAAPWYINFMKSEDGVVIRNQSGEGPGYIFLSFSNKIARNWPAYNNTTNLRNGTENVPDIGEPITGLMTQVTSQSSEPLKSIYNKFTFEEDETPLYAFSWNTNPNDTYEDQYDFVYNDIDSFYNARKSEGFVPPRDPSNNPTLKKEPYFYFKVSGSYNPEYTITWDTHGSYAEGFENEYGIKVYVSSDTNIQDNSAWFTGWKNKKAVRQSDVYPPLLNSVAFTFTKRDLENLYTLWGGYLDHSFIISIQVVDSVGLPVNNRFTTFRITKGVELDSSSVLTYGNGIDSAPTDTQSVSERNNGIMDYTDGRPVGQNTNQDGERNSNGSSISPAAVGNGINNYSPTQSQENGIDYGTSLSDLGTNLKGLVNSISGLSEAFAMVFTWLPSWVVTLIAVSLGMLVVIGTIKLILR